jgi:hypothetical protein
MKNKKMKTLPLKQYYRQKAIKTKLLKLKNEVIGMCQITGVNIKLYK